MTRELKLALIVGFALVLVVTVLISDHLSHARQAELAGNIPAEPLKVAEPPALALGNDAAAQLTPPAPATQNPSSPSPAINDPLNLAAAGPTTSSVVTPAPEPTTINLGAHGNQPPAEHADLINDIRRLGGDVRGDTIFVGQQPAMKTVQETLPASTGPLPQPRNTTVLPLNPLHTSTPVAPATPDRVYTVAAGDNAFKIAKQFYGDGKAWRKLAKYNKLSEDGQLKVGAKLNIPSAETLLGKKAVTATTVLPTSTTATPVILDRARTPAPASGGIVLTGSRTAAASAPGAAKPHTYTVKKGDTLAEIAQRQLGSARRAHEIVDLNKATIKDPDSVPLGAVLTLPA